MFNLWQHHMKQDLEHFLYLCLQSRLNLIQEINENLKNKITILHLCTCFTMVSSASQFSICYVVHIACHLQEMLETPNMTRSGS